MPESEIAHNVINSFPKSLQMNLNSRDVKNKKVPVINYTEYR